MAEYFLKWVKILTSKEKATTTTLVWPLWLTEHCISDILAPFIFRFMVETFLTCWSMVHLVLVKRHGWCASYESCMDQGWRSCALNTTILPHPPTRNWRLCPFPATITLRSTLGKCTYFQGWFHPHPPTKTWRLRPFPATVTLISNQGRSTHLQQ